MVQKQTLLNLTENPSSLSSGLTHCLLPTAERVTAVVTRMSGDTGTECLHIMLCQQFINMVLKLFGNVRVKVIINYFCESLRLVDFSERDWHSEIVGSRYLHFYNYLKSLLMLSKYLTHLKHSSLICVFIGLILHIKT